jgi:hypothetical protein
MFSLERHSRASHLGGCITDRAVAFIVAFAKHAISQEHSPWQPRCFLPVCASALCDGISALGFLDMVWVDLVREFHDVASRCL